MDEMKTLILNVTGNCAINLVVNVSDMVHRGRRHVRTRRRFNTYTRARHATGVTRSGWISSSCISEDIKYRRSVQRYTVSSKSIGYVQDCSGRSCHLSFCFKVNIVLFLHIFMTNNIIQHACDAVARPMPFIWHFWQWYNVGLLWSLGGAAYKYCTKILAVLSSGLWYFT